MLVFQSFAVWCLLASDLQFSVTALETCKTAWFDERNVSSDGDSELLKDLRMKHWMRICSNPVDMEAQTVSGVKSHHTGNTFHTYSASEGVVCLNSEQTGRQCDNYKVMFTCTGQFCSECRTRWFDHDDPTGYGDYEVLSDLLNIYPREICPQPIAIEVQTIFGEPASNTSDTFLNYDATYGFACVNAVQGSGKCEDYQVRFTCPKDFCQGCRTRWFNVDNPTNRGDYETLLQLQMLYPSQVCAQPVAIEAMTVSGIPAHESGDVFQMYDATRGFACVNAEQPGGKRCQDYKVRLTCPLAFCSV